MTVFHQVFCSVGESDVRIQVSLVMGETFYPSVSRCAVVVSSMTYNERGFVDRRVIRVHYLLKILIRERSLNALSRSLIARFKNVNLFCEHLVY